MERPLSGMSVFNKDYIISHWRQLFVITGIVASRFFVFFQQIVAAKFIDKHEFGLATLSFSMISIFLPILSLSFAELSYRYAHDSQSTAQAYDRYGGLISRVLPASFFMFAAAGCALFLLGYELSYPFHNIIYVYVNFWFVQTLGAYRVLGKDYAYSLALIRFSILSVSILYVLLIGGWGYDALPVSAVSACILSLAFKDVRWAFMHVYWSFLRIRTIQYARLIYDVVLVAITNMVSQAYLYLDIFVANYFFTPSDVADLRAPSLIVIMASVLPVMFFSYYAPRMAGAKDFKAVHQYYKLYLKIVFPVGVMILLIMFFATKLLISIMYGNEYSSAEALFKWYALIIFINLLVRAPIGNVLALQGHYRFNLILSSVFLLVMVMLQFLLSGSIGVAGIPIATLVVAMAAGAMSLRYYFVRLRAA